MKSERRHELQTNELAQALSRAPDLWARYGGRLLLGLFVIVAIIWLIGVRRSQSRQAEDFIARSLNEVRGNINQLPTASFGTSAEEVYADRKERMDAIDAMLDQVLKEADNPTLRAEALLARGDMHWTLATAPEPFVLPSTQPATQPTTQPLVLRPVSPDAHLTSAQEAYEQVLKGYPDQTQAIAAAQFGLAAVAEQRGNWDRAAELYQAVVDMKDLGPAFHNYAEARLKAVPDLRKPVTLAPPATRPAFSPTPGLSDLSLDLGMMPELQALPTEPMTVEVPQTEASPDPASPPSTQPAPAE